MHALPQIQLLFSKFSQNFICDDDSNASCKVSIQYFSETVLISVYRPCPSICINTRLSISGVNNNLKPVCGFSFLSGSK